MTTPVVVATDFSPSARVALGHAQRIAGERGVPLHAVAVIDSEQVAAIASSVPFSRDDVERQILARGTAMLNKELAEAGVRSVEHAHVRIGRPGREIVEACERLGAGLLVVGYHGRSARKGKGPGSVATRCVRHAPCDVLLTREEHVGSFNRVVVGVDFSSASLAIVARAAEMAGNGEVVLLHAHADPFESLGYMGLGLGVEQPIPLEDYQNAIGTDLERIAAGLRGAVKGGVRSEVILDSHYGRAISEWCNRNAADLTVVGTMGKPGMRYWLLGSTAEYVLKETESAVLAVRGHE